MNPKRAREIVETWRGWGPEVDEVFHRHMQEELVSMLSESAEVGVDSYLQEPCIVALEGERLVRIGVAGRQAPDGPGVDMVAVSLTPTMPLRLSTRRQANESGDPYLERVWTLRPADGDAIDFGTFAGIGRPLLDESGDELMRKVAVKLGWPIPEPDLSPGSPGPASA